MFKNKTQSILSEIDNVSGNSDSEGIKNIRSKLNQRIDPNCKVNKIQNINDQSKIVTCTSENLYTKSYNCEINPSDIILPPNNHYQEKHNEKYPVAAQIVDTLVSQHYDCNYNKHRYSTKSKKAVKQSQKSANNQNNSVYLDTSNIDLTSNGRSQNKSEFLSNTNSRIFKTEESSKVTKDNRQNLTGIFHPKKKNHDGRFSYWKKNTMIKRGFLLKTSGLDTSTRNLGDIQQEPNIYHNDKRKFTISHINTNTDFDEINYRSHDNLTAGDISVSPKNDSSNFYNKIYKNTAFNHQKVKECNDRNKLNPICEMKSIIDYGIDANNYKPSMYDYTAIHRYKNCGGTGRQGNYQNLSGGTCSGLGFREQNQQTLTSQNNIHINNSSIDNGSSQQHQNSRFTDEKFTKNAASDQLNYDFLEKLIEFSKTEKKMEYFSKYDYEDINGQIYDSCEQQDRMVYLQNLLIEFTHCGKLSMILKDKKKTDDLKYKKAKLKQYLRSAMETGKDNKQSMESSTSMVSYKFDDETKNAYKVGKVYLPRIESGQNGNNESSENCGEVPLDYGPEDSDEIQNPNIGLVSNFEVNHNLQGNYVKFDDESISGELNNGVDKLKTKKQRNQVAVDDHGKLVKRPVFRRVKR